MISFLSRAVGGVETLANASALVPRSSVEAGLSETDRRILEDPLFGDGLVSLERLTQVNAGARKVAPVVDVVRRLADEHVAKPGVEQLQIELEARSAQTEKTLRAYEKDGWERSADAPKQIAGLRLQLHGAQDAATTSLTQLGIDKPQWYAAWSGWAAALDGKVTELERRVARAEEWVKAEPTFAKDVDSLTGDQLEALASGLEACERVGWGFRATQHNNLVNPRATIIAAISSGDSIYYGVLQWASGGLQPRLDHASQVKSLPQLVDIIEHKAKRDLSILKGQ
jgi:hypothetical protein